MRPLPRRGLTVYDDRGRCAHFGRCTARLPEVFRAAAEPFVDPRGAPAARIPAVVSGCPSGRSPTRSASTPSRSSDARPPRSRRSWTESVPGAGRDRGRRRGRATLRAPRAQALCRCGHSRDKPFCDGSHWYAGFRDPLPPELVTRLPSLYDWVGGREALERLTARFSEAILSEPDPVLSS